VDSFDAVVIGSGFGGAVTAYRLSTAKKSVCLLERGKDYPPNSFPRSPYTFASNFWEPASGRLGLFNAWSFDHMDAIVSAGLGGGSLIYANVLIRKDERWFQSDDGSGPRAWPVSRKDLEPHYAVAEQMLNAQVFPMKTPPYDQVRKAVEFKRAALALGFEETTYNHVHPDRRQWYLPQLAITFKNKGQEPVPGEHIIEEVRNLHDRDRETCRLCGECDLGCNYGSKNTLDYNYLTHAKANGADLRTLAEVKRFSSRPGGGFVIDYIDHSSTDSDAHGGVPKQVEARHLILSAGTLGSTYLLLKHKKEKVFPALSPVLGHRFSGIGDLLTFIMNATSHDVDGEHPRIIDPSHGPVITSTLRSPDALDGAEPGSLGFYLQDAGYPGFVDWLVQIASLRSDLRGLAAFVLHRIRSHVFHRGGPELDADLAQLFSDTRLSAGSMPLLGMGRDTPDGVFGLDQDGRLALDWNKQRSQPFYDGVVAVSKKIATELDAEFLENPITHLLSRLITVHPLGGCPMGATRAEGVVDEWGRVHDVPGLHVADGSVVPGPVGANPSLTIAALADRFADQLLRDLDRNAD
jgi:cholesterol oxidase